MSTIETERLILKPIAVTDFAAICALWTEPDVYRHITGAPMAAETVWMRLLRDLGHWQIFGHGNWSVRLKETDQHIGNMGVFDYKRDIEPAFDAFEVGWVLSSAFHGKGYASEALTAVMAYADEALNLPRTLAMINPDNEPSLKLALRVGFKPLRSSVFHDDPVFILERLAAK